MDNEDFCEEVTFDPGQKRAHREKLWGSSRKRDISTCEDAKMAVARECCMKGLLGGCEARNLGGDHILWGPVNLLRSLTFILNVEANVEAANGAFKRMNDRT